LNGLLQFLIHVEIVNLWDYDINAMNKDAEAVLIASKEVGVEVQVNC
jgi:hypothetical protein